MSNHQRQGPGQQAQLQSYFVNHIRVFLGSLGRLYQFKGPSAMTIAVIAIALALPTGLYVMLQNAQSLSGGWDGAAKASVYMKHGSTPAQEDALVATLKTHQAVDAVTFISASESLALFKERSGFGEALDTLPNNPLPAVVIVTPTRNASTPAALDAFKQEFSQHPHVDLVQLDLDWVKRLIGIMNIIQRALLVVASMLGIAVILVIGNTIRLDIQNRHREIRVQKMIGATNAFIRRPFLYTGFWYGLFGGVAAWLLVAIGLSLLSGPAERLAGLYQSQFELQYLGIAAGFTVIFTSITLGYLGSWIAVGRHLKEIEPGQ